MQAHHIAQSNTSSGQEPVEVVIDFDRIVDFFVIHWKKLLIGAALGLLIGFSYWAFFAPYKSELMLLNKFNTNTNTNANANANNTIDFITWQQLVKRLPNLANKILSQNESDHQYGLLTSPKWWSKNVTPIYALSKSDMKDLSSNPKDLEVGNAILGLLILGSGSTANAVGSNMLAVAQFIRSGGAYLAIESLMGGYEMVLNQDSAQIDERMISLQINAENLRKQVAILESLRKQFPQPAGNGAQQLDLKSSDAKYLPLTTQLIAVNADLAQNQDNQVMLRSKQEELVVLNQFVVAAKALLKNEFDGLKLVQQMLKLQAEIDKGISNPSLYQKRILGQIKLDLVSIDTRYGVGLEVYQQSAVSRGGMWLFVLGGLILGATLVVFSLLAQGFWQRHFKLRSLAS